MKDEHGPYFEALEKHPRLLVGTEVPAIGREGMETLRTTADAKEWQEAVKSVLVQDIQSRVGVHLDESATFLETVHQSIELFQSNRDLVPGVAGFNRPLADEFAKLAKPYEIRDDEGHLTGYSIPVQPLIDNLRTQLAARKPAAPAAPTAPAAPQSSPAAAPAGTRSAPPAGQPPTPPGSPPQAGLTSKSGSASEREDFATLFGTIGLPNLNI